MNWGWLPLILAAAAVGGIRQLPDGGTSRTSLKSLREAPSIPEYSSSGPGGDISQSDASIDFGQKTWETSLPPRNEPKLGSSLQSGLRETSLRTQQESLKLESSSNPARGRRQESSQQNGARSGRELVVHSNQQPHGKPSTKQPSDSVTLRNRSGLLPTALRGFRPRLDMTTELFLVPATPPAAVVIQTHPSPSGPSDPPVRNRTLLPPPAIRTESWVFPLIITSGLTMFLIAGFEVFVLCKAWRTNPSRRHLFLGQMLLLGLFMCAGLGGLVAVTPNTATCAVLRFGSGLSFALVFATLLVKTVFLISLNSGVYLPAPYQGLLLLFAVLIQVVLGVQWLFNSPPKVEIRVEDLPPRRRLIQLVTVEDLTPLAVCQTPYSELLLSFLYVVFLIGFVAILAVKSRGIRDNYREATYIGLSVGCLIPLWMAWAVTGLILSDRHRDACLGFGLVSTAAVTFLIMFMPKGRQLAAMGKDGIYLEDRDDRFSSLTPVGSGYSPSFFHIKPVKYGVVGEPLTTPHATHKTAITAVPSIGDRIPSYTRMYHYYPPLYPGYCPPRYPQGAQESVESSTYKTQAATMSSNPNVFFGSNGFNAGLMY